MTDDTHIKSYEEAGKYVLRELTLINNRLTWILTIHGFLYATYGLTIQKQIEIFHTMNSKSTFQEPVYPLCVSLTQSEYFLFTIAFVGIAISGMGLVSITAACHAMTHISEIFIKSNLDHFTEDSIDGLGYYKTRNGNYSFPHLLGGGKYITNGRGNSAARLIPLALLMSWGFALYTSYTIRSNNENLFCSVSYRPNK